MNSRVGLFHGAVGAIAPITAEWRTTAPEVALAHYVDEGFLAAIERDGPQPAVVARLARWLDCIARDGVDAILMTCSCASPLAPALRPTLRCPLVAIDEAMLADALAAGSRLGIVATLPAAAETTERLLRAAATRPLTTSVRVAPGAAAHLRAGQTAEHDTAIRSAIAELGQNLDAIVLAQVSMRSAVAGSPPGTFPVPVLTSGASAVRRILDLLGRPPASRS